MLIVGIISLVIAAILIVVHVMAKRRIGAIASARPQRAADLKALSSTMAAELGDGSLNEVAALSGTGHSDTPLTSPLGDRLCLAYRMSISRKYEEEYEEKDSDGNWRTRTRSGTETMSTQNEEVDFDLGSTHQGDSRSAQYRR